MPMYGQTISTAIRCPWTIHLIAGCYAMPPVIVAILSISGYWGEGWFSLIYLFTLVALVTGVNLWALYRPHRITRWIPIATPLLGILAIALVFLVVAPWAKRTATSDCDWILPLICFIFSALITGPTLLGAVLLLAMPSTRRYLFGKPSMT